MLNQRTYHTNVRSLLLSIGALIAFVNVCTVALSPSPVGAEEDLSSVREVLSLEGKGFQSWLEGIKTVDLATPSQTEAFRETIKERLGNVGIKVVSRGEPVDASLALFLNPKNKSSLLVYQEVLLKRNPKVKTFAIPTYSLNVPNYWASSEVSSTLMMDQFLYDYKMANNIIDKSH